MFKTRLLAGAMAAAMALSAATPAMAWYRRPGPGPGVALGILGGIVAGAAIANALRPPPPPVYYAPQPQPYYAPPRRTYAPRPRAYHPAPATTEIALTRGNTDDGFHTVALVNGVPINFEVDTGADTVFLPQRVALRLIHEGKITPSDVTNLGAMTSADNSSSKVLYVTLASITLGGHTVHNVEAMLGTKGDMPLLGQTFFKHFATVTIDNTRSVLRLGPQVG